MDFSNRPDGNCNPLLFSSHDSLDINVTSKTEYSLQLLLKILETSSVNVDVKAVAAAWRKFPLFRILSSYEEEKASRNWAESKTSKQHKI